MGIKIYEQNKQITVGITLRKAEGKDNHNMAFHENVKNEDIIHNRKNLAHMINLDLTDFTCATQTHGVTSYKVTDKNRGQGALVKDTALYDVDGLYTYERELVLCTFAADCVPLMFYNKRKGLIGVIHSGWRGTVNEITCKLFNKLILDELCDIKDFTVYIGPAISEEKFEVDEDVYQLFKKLSYAKPFITYKSSTNKYHINNKEIVRAQCERAGIPSENIFIDPMCTFKSNQGFSHRENKTPQRHMGFIVQY